MTQIIAHRGEISLQVDFDGYDVDEPCEYTCTGTKDTAELYALLNSMAGLYGSQDGVAGAYGDEDRPRHVINALRLADFNIVLPDIWEAMDLEETPDGIADRTVY